jgi:hypothetical protein
MRYALALIESESAAPHQPFTPPCDAGGNPA